MTSTVINTALSPVTDIAFIADHTIVKAPFESRKNDIVQMIASSKALLKGHFELMSHMHSDYFLRFSKIAEQPKNLELLSDLLTQEIVRQGLKLDAILSPDTTGVLLAHEISRKLNVKRITAKTNERKYPTDLINFVDLSPGDNVLLVNDMTTTGGGLGMLRDLVKKYLAIPVGIALFAIRDEERKDLSRLGQIIAVADLKLGEYEYRTRDACPICKQTGFSEEPIKSWMLN